MGDSELFYIIGKCILLYKNAPRDAHSLNRKNARREEFASRLFVLAGKGVLLGFTNWNLI